MQVNNLIIMEIFFTIQKIISIHSEITFHVFQFSKIIIFLHIYKHPLNFFL